MTVAGQGTPCEDTRQGAYRLRAATRWVATSPRERGCGVWCVEHTDEHPTIKVERKGGRSVATWRGLMTCGHIWTCPVCSANKRAARVGRIERALQQTGGRWQMLTVTLRHHEGMPLRELVRGLMAAWRRTRQGGKIQRIWQGRVSASVRALEVTHGANGWHPHVHVLLRTTEWSDDEREALQDRWELAIVRELGEHVRPDDLHGLTWSKPLDASSASDRERGRYLAKAGLEVAGVAKQAKGSSTWDIARRAVEGDSRGFWLWREFYEATKGRRAIELDDRAAAAAKRHEEAEGSKVAEGEGGTLPKYIEVQRDDVRALRAWERSFPAIMAVVLHAAEGEHGELAVREWVAVARARMTRHRPTPHATSPPVHDGTLQ